MKRPRSADARRSAYRRAAGLTLTLALAGTLITLPAADAGGGLPDSLSFLNNEVKNPLFQKPTHCPPETPPDQCPDGR